jgi:hypothetical protein
MSKIHLCTYGSHRFEYSRWRLAKEAEETGWFDNIHVYGKEHIGQFGRSVEGTGAGFWWWKSEIQKMTMDKMQDGDIMVYVDAGCYLNKAGEKEFKRYISLAQSNEIGAVFFNGSPESEKYYTKRDTLILMGCDDPIYIDSQQIASGLYIVVKNKNTIELVDNFVKASRIDHLLNIDPSLNSEYPEFILHGSNHRHDQSVFSLTVKKLFNDKSIDIITLDHTEHDDNIYRYHMEITSVEKYFAGVIDILTDIRFPIITARIDDTKLFGKIATQDYIGKYEIKRS